MGIIIFVIILLTEIALMIYCIKTKQNQNGKRCQIRIAEWLIFVGALITPLVEWSFRWYFLMAVLTALAVIGGLRLWTNKLGAKPYTSGRIVLNGIAMMVIMSMAVLPAVIFPQYELPAVTGDLQVETATYTFTDQSRIETFSDAGEHRKLNVEIWYPKNANGQYPLIVFSHGAFGVKMSNTSTCMELASHGYVVCAIDHPYHAVGTVDGEGQVTIGSKKFMQEVLEINSGHYDERAQYEIFGQWMKLRTEDMNFVLGQLLSGPEATNTEINSLIDADKIGLMGHSLGGAASAQLGRDRGDISAVINLDGSMLGEYRLSAVGTPTMNEVPYPLPLLNFYSEEVLSALKAEPETVYINHHISKISPMAFETHIQGSNHMSYTDLPLFSPFLAKQLSGISGGATEARVDPAYAIETMNKLVLEFFNCFLKDTGEFAVMSSY